MLREEKRFYKRFSRGFGGLYHAVAFGLVELVEQLQMWGGEMARKRED